MLPDWIELCALFNVHRVDFLLIGGQAVIAHGYHRLTKDMDLWVRPTTSNGARLLSALAEFGVEVPGFTAERFSDPSVELTLQFGVERRTAKDYRISGGILQTGNEALVDVGALSNARGSQLSIQQQPFFQRAAAGFFMLAPEWKEPTMPLRATF